MNILDNTDVAFIEQVRKADNNIRQVTVGPQLYDISHITAGCHGSIRNKSMLTACLWQVEQYKSFIY